MAITRMPRLELVLGAPIGVLQWESLEDRVSTGLEEQIDLEFKSAHYDRDQAGELAKDVAALANAAGGLILLGVVEEGGVSRSLSPIDLVGGYRERYTQIVAARVSPLPQFDIVQIPSRADATVGVVALVVPRSPNAPHAVVKEGALRYPRRHGATTGYLSEPEVADAYRRRIVSAREQAQAAALTETDLLETLNPREPWLVITAVPDLSGSLTIDRQAAEAFRSRVVGKRAAMPWYGVHFDESRTGFRRMRADGGMGRDPETEALSSWCAMEWHADGTGTYAIRVPDLATQAASFDVEHGMTLIDDEAVAGGLLCGLEWLAEHAHAAGAGGMLNIRARLWPTDGRKIGIGHTRQFGTSAYAPAVRTSPVSQVSAPIEDLYPAGANLVGTAALILRDLGQWMGVPELGHLSVSGEIRRRYWTARYQDALNAWGQDRGVTVTDEVLA